MTTTITAEAKLPREVCNGYRPATATAFDADGDCETLHKAMAGLGTNDDVLIEILTSRTPEEVWKINQAYKAKYNGKKLKDAIEGDTSGSFENILVALCHTPVAFDVKELHGALSGLGTRESTLIDVLTTRSNAELEAIKDGYKKKYNKELLADIEGDTTGKFERGLRRLCQAKRSETLKADVDLARKQAHQLFQAGENAWGTNEDVFIDILCANSAAQNMAVSKAYAADGKKTLEEAIRSETSGDFEDLLLALINPADYVASLFRDAIGGIGTSSNRIIALGRRANKAFLRQVKISYERKYKMGLVAALESETSGSFRKCLRRMLITSEADYAASRLREATKGLGTESQTLVDVLGDERNDVNERRFIADAYQRDYGEALAACMESETHGSFEKLLVALSTPPEVYKARMLRKAMSGAGTDEDALIDILVSSTSAELAAIATIYEKEFAGRHLVDDIKSETSRHFEALLVRLARAKQRTPGKRQLDAAGVAAAVAKLHKAGEGRMGTDEDAFISVIAELAVDDLDAINQAYAQAHGHPLTQAIKKETSGHLKDGLLACMHPHRFGAKQLARAMKGLGTDDDALVRTIAIRDGPRLAQVKAVFHDVAGEDLQAMIEGDTSGKYRQLLLKICGFAPKE